MRRTLLMLLGLCGGLMAQGPMMFPWWDSPIARDLNLTEEQNGQVRSIVNEYRTKLTQLRTTIDTAETMLRNVMDEEQFDPRRAQDAAERSILARAELSRAASEMSIRIRQVLTTKQYQELKQRTPNRDRFPGGPGGPGWRRRPGGSGQTTEKVPGAPQQ